MTLEPAVQRRLIQAVADRVIVHAGELVELDQAIGDGDHGLNMQRGFEAVLGELEAYAAMPLEEALKAIGMTLVRSVGGASGPLYGTLFMALGRSLPADPSREAIAAAFAAAIDAVKARGKSDIGQKTMLDVLVPVLQALRAARGELADELRAAARAAAAATVPMRATRGRASFLGDRSIGHMDPGARSSELMVQAVADVMEGRV